MAAWRNGGNEPAERSDGSGR